MHFFDICMLCIEHFSFIFFNYISFTLPVMSNNFALRMCITYGSRMLGAILMTIIGVNIQNTYFMQSLVYLSSIALGSQLSSESQTQILIWKFIQSMAIGAQIPSFVLLGISVPFVISSVTISYIIAFVLHSNISNISYLSIIFYIVGYAGIFISGYRALVSNDIQNQYKKYVFIYMSCIAGSLYCIQAQTHRILILYYRLVHQIDMHCSQIDIAYIKHYLYLILIVCVTLIFIYWNCCLKSYSHDASKMSMIEINIITIVAAKMKTIYHSILMHYQRIIIGLMCMTYSFMHNFAFMALACQNKIMYTYVISMLISLIVSIMMHYKVRLLCQYMIILFIIMRIILPKSTIVIFLLGQFTLTYAMNTGLKLLSSMHPILCIILYNIPAIIAALINHPILSYNYLLLWLDLLSLMGIGAFLLICLNPQNLSLDRDAK